MTVRRYLSVRGAPRYAGAGARARLARLDRWWAQAVLVFGLYSLYGWARSMVEGPASVAFDNALDVIAVERWLHLYVEQPLQGWFLQWPTVVRAWNVFYGTVHFAVPVFVFVLLWRRDRERYRFWRDAFLAICGLALIGFILYPLMPPRLLPSQYGFVDTAAVLGPFSEDPEDAANLYAAMPSLHIGLATWCMLAGLPLVGRRWLRVAMVLYPPVMLLATMVTANHYWLDGAGGVVALVLAMLAATGLGSLRGRGGGPERDVYH